MSQNTELPREAQVTRDDPALLPPVDVIEDDSGITLYADLPGVPRDKLSLQVDGDQLTLDGEMALEMPKGLEATHLEVGVPRYRRVFTLSKELDAGSLQAEFRQGVLKLHIQRAQHTKPRRIEVKAA